MVQMLFGQLWRGIFQQQEYAAVAVRVVTRQHGFNAIGEANFSGQSCKRSLIQGSHSGAKALGPKRVFLGAEDAPILRQIVFYWRQGSGIGPGPQRANDVVEILRFYVGRKRGLNYEIANQEAAIGLADRGILAKAHVAHAGRQQEGVELVSAAGIVQLEYAQSNFIIAAVIGALLDAVESSLLQDFVAIGPLRPVGT